MNMPRAGREVAAAAASTRATRPPRRDPQRTKAALLDAALAEFAEKGLAGARVDEIAARAGVNKQLISYYFGGKDGLHQALSDEWRLRDQAIIDPSRPLEDVVAGLLQAVYEDPRRVRFSIRESLDQDPANVTFEPEDSGVVDLRSRRQAGEIGDELDPAFVLLLLESAVLSGAVFAADTKRLLGLDPGSPEHIVHMGEQLRRLVRRLAAEPPSGDTEDLPRSAEERAPDH